jgi:hypothetical protein
MRRTFPPNNSEVTTRVYETMPCCSLKPLTAEAPYDGPLLMQKYRDENCSFAQLQSHCILGNRLRSLELMPTAEGALQPPSGWAARVQELAEKRSQKLKQLVAGFKASTQKAHGISRFVAYAPENNLFEGAAEVQSQGFFDAHNVPPRDTCIALVDRYVLAWVPPLQFEFARRGIEVNPEQCIKWADDPSLSHQQNGKMVRAMLGTEL